MEKKFEYKIIGWTGCTDRRFPNYNQSKEAYSALLEDIRKNGYKFGGDKHEDYVPVFNDGTAARFSWRGWGGVMADAWQPENSDPYKYSLYYMNTLLKPEAVHYPKTGVDFSLIENKRIHKLALDDREFINNRYLCEKSLFIYLMSDGLKEIKQGDFVDFTDNETEESVMGETLVVNVYYATAVEKILEEMEENLPDWKDLSEELGFAKKLKKEELAELIRKKISPDGEQKRGVWGIEVFYP